MHVELTEAALSLEIMDALTHHDTIAIFERYVGFFGPTFEAHKNRFTIKVHNVAGKDSRGPNIHRAWRIIEEDTDLSDRVDLSTLRGRLVALKPILERLERVRHKRSAHHEMYSKVPSILRKELRPTLEQLQDIVRVTSVQSLHQDMWFNLPSGQDASLVMEALTLSLEESKRLIEATRR